MDELQKLRYKKTRQQLRYLQIELEETKLVYAQSLDKFNMEFSEYLAKQSDKQEHSDTIPDNPFERIESDVDEEILKEIYKKIAVKVHPDKQTGNEEKFKILNSANKNKDYGAMLELADELNIESTVPYNEHTYNQMKKQIRAVIETVKKMQCTIAWQWNHIEDNQRPIYKDHILKQIQI